MYSYSDSEIKKLLKGLVIYVDTQEKVNKHIIEEFDSKKIAYEKKALSFGDYSCKILKNEELAIYRDLDFRNKIAIERKNSVEELSGNFGNGRTQFENEFLRAKNCKIFLMIEQDSWKDIENNNYRTKLEPKTFFASLFTFQHRYNINVTFVEKDFAWKYIYMTMYYYVREYLKGGI